MLSYVVFYSLILVQVMEGCYYNEFRRQIINFNQSDVIEPCITGEYAHLRLPTEWTDCWWPCIGKGFEVIEREFSQSNFTCTKDILDIASRAVAVKRKCQPKYCSRSCEHFTPGNIRNFLIDVLRTLQTMERKN